MSNRLSAAIASALLIWGLAAPVAADEEELPALAVMLFADETGNEWWVYQGSDRARDVFVESLAGSGRYRVLTRDELDPRLQEHKLTALAGRISPAAAVKAGRLLGVRYLVTATLGEFGSAGRRMMGLKADRSFRARLEARLIDAESGSVVWAQSSSTQATVDRPPKRKDMDDPIFQERMFERVLRPIARELAQSLARTDLDEEAP